MPPPAPSGTTESICTERSAGPAAGVGVTGGVVVGGDAGGVEVAGGVTTGAVAGFTITVALPCTCFEVVALGIKTMESGTLVEAVPERSGVTVSVLLVVATVYAARSEGTRLNSTHN